MDKAQIRGELFIKVVRYINKKWGAEGLEKLNIDLGQYKQDVWYGLDEFCDLIDGLYDVLGVTDSTEPFKIGKWIVTNNPRWMACFRGMDPKDVFTGSEHQELQYVVGEFKGAHSKPNEVSVHSTVWTTDQRHLDVWCEFYRGRLQGVLDLTGYQGEVSTISEMLENEATCTYKITWT